MQSILIITDESERPMYANVVPYGRMLTNEIYAR